MASIKPGVLLDGNDLLTLHMGPNVVLWDQQLLQGKLSSHIGG